MPSIQGPGFHLVVYLFLAVEVPPDPRRPPDEKAAAF